MKFWARFFKKTKPLIPPPPEGQAAHRRAMEKMAEIDERWSTIYSTTQPMRKFRNDNHLAEQIEHIFRERREER